MYQQSNYIINCWILSSPIWKNTKSRAVVETQYFAIRPVYTSKLYLARFALTIFIRSYKQKHATKLTLTSVLVEKLECQFFSKYILSKLNLPNKQKFARVNRPILGEDESTKCFIISNKSNQNTALMETDQT